MWWKIYFWIFTFVIALGLIGLYSPVTSLKIVDWLVITDVCLLVLGTFLFGYSKFLFTKSFWKTYFSISLASFLLGILYESTPLKQLISIPAFLIPSYSQEEISAAWMIFGNIFVLPAYYAIYNLSFKKKK